MVVKLIPLYVAIIALAGFGYALWLRNSDRSRYDMIGQLHDEEMMDAFVDEMYVADGRSPN